MRTAPDKLPADLDWQMFRNPSPETKRTLAIFFSKMIKFMNGIIITDNQANHDQRAEWEMKYIGTLSPAAQEYYNNNRLGINFSSALVNFYKCLDPADNKKEEWPLVASQDYEILKSFVSLIPSALNDAAVYDKLDIKEKISDVEELAPLVGATIRHFGEKPVNLN